MPDLEEGRKEERVGRKEGEKGKKGGRQANIITRECDLHKPRACCTDLSFHPFLHRGGENSGL